MMVPDLFHQLNYSVQVYGEIPGVSSGYKRKPVKMLSSSALTYTPFQSFETSSQTWSPTFNFRMMRREAWSIS